jgi:small-conductance mechanosensitive channel/CRP-like cAMP-binding protein
MGNTALGIICALLFVGVTQLVLRRLRRFGLIRKITPAVTLLLLYFAYLILRMFYPFPIGPKLNQSIEALALFLGLFILILVVETIIVDYTYPLRKKTPPPSLLRDIIRWVLVIVILFALFQNILNIDVSSIVFTSAAVTIVVGLALQDLLGNLFAGITLNMSRPFKIGDWMQIGSMEGQVVNMTWRETGLKTLDMDYVVIPNSTVSKEMLINCSSPDKLDARHIKVGVSYDAPPNTAKDVMAEAALQSKGVLAQPAPEVWLVDFGDFAITYELKFWIDDYQFHNQIEDEVHTRIWYAFRRHGIHIPFPIRNIYMRRVPREEEEVVRERDIAEKVSVMRSVEILQPLSDDELVTLASKVRRQHFGRGEVLVRQGDEGDSFFIITTGRVAISVKDDRGRSSIVAHLDSGDFFGEGSLLTGEPRSATVTVTQDAKVIIIDKFSFSEILKQNPSIAESLSHILENRLKELAEKKAASEKKVEKEPVEPFTVILKKIKNFFGI